MNAQFDYYEAAVLSLTLRSEYAAQVFSRVSPDDFSPELRDYAQAAKDLLEDSKPVDLITVAELMESRGVVTPGAMLADIFEHTGRTSIENLDAYCDILARRGLRRGLSQATMKARELIETEENPEVAHEKVLALFESLKKSDKADKNFWDMTRAARAFFEEMEVRNEAGGALIGLSTGYQMLDDRINGLRGGDLVVVAGRPSMGKTTFAMNVVEHNAVRQNLPCLVFSMEMGATQIIEKMTASLGGINMTSLRRGALTDEEWAKFGAAGSLVAKANLHIDDRGGLSVAQMRARCHEVKRKTGHLALIMVDYIQLMQSKGAENRTNEITKISGGLKALAKEFDCPVIALSQLNRGVEQRQDKRPVMSDLRESGAIEQDADIIIFPYRGGYYDNPDDPDPMAEIIFGKIRMGERGTDYLEFQGKYSRFKAFSGAIDFSAMERERVAREPKAKKKRGMEL